MGRNKIARNRKVRFFVLVIACLGITTVSAQDSREVVGDFNVINGAIEPDKIPYSVKVSSLLWHYDYLERQGMALSLSQSDGAVIEAMIGSEEFNVAEESRQYRANLSELCSRMDVMDAMPLAIEYEQQAEDSRSVQADRYRKSLSQLSDAGKKTIDQYITEQVTPGIKLGRSSSLEVAKSDPEVFKFNIELICYANEHGELPPGVFADKDKAVPEGQQAESSSGDSFTFEN